MRSEEEVRENAALGTTLTPLDTKEYEELEKVGEQIGKEY
jgi:hypothetical protein